MEQKVEQKVEQIKAYYRGPTVTLAGDIRYTSQYTDNTIDPSTPPVTTAPARGWGQGVCDAIKSRLNI